MAAGTGNGLDEPRWRWAGAAWAALAVAGAWGAEPTMAPMAMPMGGMSMPMPTTAPAGAGGAAARPAGRDLSSADSVLVRRFRFEGNTVYSSSDLELVARHAVAEVRAGHDCTALNDDPKKSIAGWAKEARANPPADPPPLRLTVEDLEAVRRCLTLAYTGAGYANSGVVLPDQDVDGAGGAVVYRVDEGVLKTVTIHPVDRDYKPLDKDGKGGMKFNRGYLTRVITVSAGRVLNVTSLKGEMERLRQDPNVTRVNAELKPGVKPNESDLDVQLEEANRFHFGLDFNNRRPPSVGAERFEAFGSDTNVTGFDDPFNFHYTITKGDLEHLAFAGADDYGVDYAHPVSDVGTTLQIAYSRSDDPVIETPYRDLSIRSETDNFGLTLRQPAYRADDREFALTATFNERTNDTYLGGQPFEFAPGETNGHSRVTVVRLGQEYSYRDDKRAISLRSTFNVGLRAFGSTNNGVDAHTGRELPDSTFFDWLGQAQYVRRLGDTSAQLILRGNLQLAAQPLLSLEQFSIGGLDTVRGYRENEVVRDQGAVASAEVHVPILQKEDVSLVDLAPFVDVGYGWDRYETTPAHGAYPVLGSCGIGLLVHPDKHLNLQVYYGHPFVHFNRTSNIQDNGISFDVSYTFF